MATNSERLTTLEQGLTALADNDKSHEAEVSKLIENVANLRRELEALGIIAPPPAKTV